MLVAAAVVAAFIQCPDGSPPPCRSAPVAARPAGAPAPLSIAVLPFESRSPDSADAYLAEGMTEELANRLTRVARLQVKSRGLVRAQWRRTAEPIAAARGLGVAWFVHGNVRHVGGQMLVNVELVRANTGEEAWAARFPRTTTDVFAVQAEIAESVAVMVGGRLTPGEQATITRRPTVSNEAYRLYLYANVLISRRTQREAAEAVEAYQRAIVLDSNFAAAWARLSIARSIQASWGWEPALGNDSLQLIGLRAAQRALAIDQSSAEAWLAFANAESNYLRQWTARDAFERALRLDSMNAEAWHLTGTSLYGTRCPSACLSDYSRAVPLYRRALALDPTLRNTWRHLAAIEADSGLLRESEVHLDTALLQGPWAPAYGDRAYLRFLRGDATGMAADLDAAGETVVLRPGIRELRALLLGDSTPARARLAVLRARIPGSVDNREEEARLAMALGLRGEALDALEQLRARSDSSNRALCAPATPCSAHLPTWITLRDPIFQPLRSEARFQRLWAETRPRIPWR